MKGEKTQKKEPALASLTLSLTHPQIQKLQAYCDYHLWEPFTVEYAVFAFRHKIQKVTLVAYKSGKLVISGKGTQVFVQDFIEPEITGEAKLGYEEVHNPEWFETHAGMDEAGKGDVFGPLVCATVIADGDAVREWRKKGIADSKTKTDGSILKLEKVILATKNVVVKHAYCRMERYNDLMARPRANLNQLLAWLHSRALQAALAEAHADWGLVDQFSKQPLVQRQLKKDGVDFELRMRTKAESDPIVAAASICARAEFLRQMDALSKMIGEPLLKGSGALAKAQLQRIFDARGIDILPSLVKMHFKTVAEVAGRSFKADAGNDDA
jgi:ribonuclease HIII